MTATPPSGNRDDRQGGRRDEPARGGGQRGGRAGGGGGGGGQPGGGKAGGGKAGGRTGGRTGGGGRDARRREEEADPVASLAGPLGRVLTRLPDTQRRVLELRMGLADGHPHDLADTARALGLSLSETRDIEKRAFEHIREAVPVEHLQKFLKN